MPQHTALVLHDVVLSLQTLPGGEHVLPFAQRPGVVAVAPLQTTLVVPPNGRFAEPQQSPSAMQTSPVGLQPDAGWQIRNPVVNGLQDLLQHTPPHVGSAPPS